jgi:probable rRNA maturation factor
MISMRAEPVARRALGAPALRRLRTRLGRVLCHAGEEGADLSVLLCDDACIAALNRAYADEDHATDVLAFSQREGLDSPRRELLGDVVVSIETATRQACRRPGSRLAKLEAELLHLCVHGIAHLLGYDHDTESRRRVMWEREAELRRGALGQKGPRGSRRGSGRRAAVVGRHQRVAPPT